MLKFILIVISLLLTTAGFTQQRYKFHSQNYVGVLEGEGGSYMQLQTINGFQRKTWFAGIGTGLDYYYFRSVPLFLSLNKSFCDCERSFFVSLNGGYHWVWDNSTGNSINGFRDGDFSPALYLGAGLGYRIGLKNKKDAILLNIGFSAKHVKEEVKPIWVFCDFPPCPPAPSEFLSYKLNRLSLKAGWRF